MRERVVRFGAGNGLVGILTEPEPIRAHPDRPAIIFLNSGILHRVGSCRMHVRLAWALAEAGYPSLRFDLSGIGDSDTRKDALAFEQSAPLEIREAMDRMAELKDSREFILYGLCSGADAALLLAPDEPRVVGLGLIDPWAYPTPRTRLAFKMHRARQRDAWTNQLKRYLPAVFGSLPERPRPVGELVPEFEIPTYVRGLPPREEVSEMFRTVLTRGGRLFLAYMGVTLAYSYRDQFRAAFAELEFGQQLELIHLPDSDHIVTRLDHQAELDAATIVWVSRHWPIGAALSAGRALELASPLNPA